MFLNIITPCCRPQNLQQISESINIPQENYRWIVVFDRDSLPDCQLPNNCEPYCYINAKSKVGHGQRNFAKTLLTHGHVYQNDDDTLIHPELWSNIKNLDNDFISFSQGTVSGELRLPGDIIKVYHVDTHNFIISYKLSQFSSFIIDQYNADGIYAEECYAQAKNPIYIPKVLSIYNALRPEASRSTP